MTDAGHTVYTLNQEGIIQTQQQQWSISAAEALLETFTPTAGPDKRTKPSRTLTVKLARRALEHGCNV